MPKREGFWRRHARPMLVPPSASTAMVTWSVRKPTQFIGSCSLLFHIVQHPDAAGHFRHSQQQPVLCNRQRHWRYHMRNHQSGSLKKGSQHGTRENFHSPLDFPIAGMPYDQRGGSRRNEEEALG